MNKLIKGSKIFNIVGDSNKISYELMDNSSLVLNIYNSKVTDHDINILLSNNSSLVINYAGLSFDECNINIFTSINGNNNKVVIKGRFISMNGICNINVDSCALKNTFNNYIDESVKGINENGKVTINPILRIDTNEVNASHSASVGKYDKNMLFYLESKGLDEKSAKDLIKNNFLNSLFSDEFIQMIDKKRGENE